MGSDMDEPKAASGKRGGKRRSAGISGSFFPQRLVCSDHHHHHHGSSTTNVVEWGLVISICILFVYLYGFYASVMSLPSDKTDRIIKLQPELYFIRHLGQNFNLARPSKWESEVEQQRSLEALKQKQQQQQQQQELDEEDGENVGGEQQQDGNLRGGAAAAANTDNDAKKSDSAAVIQKSPEMTGEIPKGVWPVSIKTDYDTNFDILTHPGDGVTRMRVPKFWAYPVHQNKLMSRETAMKIGTCIEPDETGNYQRGDDCPADKRTIYVGIASYRDFECRSTVESIFLMAQNPERIRVGVVDQIVHGEDAICDAAIELCETNPEQALCKYAKQVDVYEMPANLSIGPVYARHIGYRMYRGEYYATQSDAHVTYTKNWDADIIQQLEATNNEMAVLSTYLTDVQGSIDANGHSLRNTRPIMCNTIYEGGPQGMHLRHAAQPERVPGIHGMPQLSPWWAAGYSFSRGHFVVNVPYDWLQPMIFQGEEMSIGIRGFTIGYDYYAPERSVCFHHYAVGENAKIRNKVHHFWENDNKYAGTGRRAMKRLLGLVHMNPEDPPNSWDHTEEDIYGIGGVRTPEKFYELFGIDVEKKTIEKHLCQFVDTDGRMHNMFQPHLRKDGMGIDYTDIHFKFKDPMPDKR